MVDQEVSMTYFIAVHTGENPCINHLSNIIQKFFDWNGSYMLRIQKNWKNPENVEYKSGILEIRKSGSGFRKKIWLEIFIKSDFRGGLCYKILL